MLPGGTIENTTDRICKMRHSAFCECFLCGGLIDYYMGLSDFFWMKAKVTKNGHFLNLEFENYETNYRICANCAEDFVEELVEDNVKVSKKLGELFPDYECRNYTRPPVFEPFVESCENCQTKIGEDESFIIIGTSMGEIDFNRANECAVFSIFKHIPILVFCEKCGSGVFGGKLLEALKCRSMFIRKEMINRPIVF
jgi:hypothetical protein